MGTEENGKDLASYPTYTRAGNKYDLLRSNFSSYFNVFILFLCLIIQISYYFILN
jgi:hypothetical protein